MSPAVFPAALDPEAAELLTALARDAVKPFDQLSVLRARALVAGSTRLQGPRVEVAYVLDVLVDAQGRSVPARVYRPAQTADSPVLCYFHGGGFVAGSVQVADRACRALAAESGWTVISLEYRLSPESPYPAALQDCLSLVRWLHREAADLAIDSGRIVLCGDSAGGALAAAATRSLRGTPYAPAGQILIYPTLGPVGSRRSPSISEFGELPSLTRSSIDWFWSHYLQASTKDDPMAVPLIGIDLAGLPATTVVVAGCDLLRDEGLDYAQRLADADVQVKVRIVEGAIHGFWWMDGVLRQARELTTYLADDLRSRASGWPGRARQ